MTEFYRFPGLSFRWDPREPLPPDFIRQGVNFGRAAASRWRGRGDANIHATSAYHIQNEDGLKITPPPTDEESVVDDIPSSAKRQRVLLPPSSSKIAAQIIQDTATITITQSFENKSTVHFEQGSYQFPLPHTAAVVDFTCRIGDSAVLRGTVKPKEEAKRAFREAVRRHRPAGLLEQDGSPEIFKMSIGNIPAGAKATTELTIILLLKHDFLPAKSVTQTTLSIPTYIAPRYGTAPTGILETGPRGPETTFSVQVEVLSAEEIIDIHSDSHGIHHERGAGKRKCQRWADFLAPQTPNDSTSAMVRLAEDISCLNKDFVLSIVTRPDGGAETPVACLETHPSLPNHGALMITLPPKFMLQHTTPNTNSEIIFLADRSGSMEDKIDGLKSAMEFFIRGIPEGRLFNIWCFGSSYTSLWTKSRAFAQDTMTEALRYISSGFNADMGGTELLPAIQAVVEARDKSRAMDMVVLTDGEVWQLDKTISFVSGSRTSGDKPVRYFALGIGDAVSRALVEGIAEAGGGYAEIIPSATDGDWEDRLVAVLSAALTGHCGRISVELDTLSREALGKQKEKPPAVQTSPEDISMLSPFVRSRVFYLFEGGMTEPCRNVTIKTTDVNGNEVSKLIPVLPLHGKDLKMHRFAVRAMLGDLEHRHEEIRNPTKRTGYYYAFPTTSQDLLLLKQEGERLGCKWSLASKWTSFVALEEGEQSKPEPITMSATTSKAADKQATAVEPKDDLGLLRPRNMATQHLLMAAAGASQAATGAMAGHAAVTRAQLGYPFRPKVVPYRRGYITDSESEAESEQIGAATDDSDEGAFADKPLPVISQLTELVSHPQLGFDHLDPCYEVFDRWDFHGGDDIVPAAACEVDYNESQGSPPPARTDRSSPEEKTTVDVTAAKAFVKKIVKYQQSNGSFVFPSDNELKKVFGAEFFNKLHDIRDVPRVVAITALLAALLEIQFEPCRGLWILVVAKVKTFVESQVGQMKGVTPVEVMAAAQRVAAAMAVLDLEEDGTVRVRRDSAEPVELVFAPGVWELL